MIGQSRTVRLIAQAAARLGVRCEPVSKDPTEFFLRLSREGAEVVVCKTCTPYLTRVAQMLANNKHVARELLAAAGIPVVADRLLDERDDPAGPRAAEFLGEHRTLVVKSNWANRALGTTPGVRDLGLLARAYAWARSVDPDEEVLLEPELPGTDLRIAVIGGRAIAAAQIERPRLVGDGRCRIDELVARLNADPRRGDASSELCSIERIELDEHLAGRLDVLGLDAASVLPAGREVPILGEEAEVIDRTEEVDPAWMRAAERACACLGVDVGGVDLRGPQDAFRVPPDGRAYLLEVNVQPALHLHALPTRGAPRPVFEAFVEAALSR